MSSLDRGLVLLARAMKSWPWNGEAGGRWILRLRLWVLVKGFYTDKLP